MRLKILAIVLTALPLLAQTASFSGVERWKGSLATSDATSLSALYSVDPPARLIDNDGKPTADITPEIDFWKQQIASGATAWKVIPIHEQDKNGLHIVSLQIAMTMPTAGGPKTRYVIEEQAWQAQGEQWRIVIAKHSDILKMVQPSKLNPNLYEKNADAKADIDRALVIAGKQNKRVILVFGGNWCYDCQVLDTAFHQPDLQPLVDKSFEVVHVDIGDDGKKNADLVSQYKVPLDKGVPALAVLDSRGKLLYSQQGGEFENARAMDPDEINLFLNKWKP